MVGKIFCEFIDDLLVWIDIVEIVDSCVCFKKVGKNYFVCCLFYNEKLLFFIVV